MIIYEIENQISRCFQYFYENNAEKIAELFTDSAVLTLPDRKTKYVGKKAIGGFWADEIKDRVHYEGGYSTVYMPCEIYVKPTEDEGGYYGEWNTYSFRSEKPGEMQYFITHMQAKFHGIYMEELIWNEVLELVPWKISLPQNPVPMHLEPADGEAGYGGLPGSCGLTLQDFIAIRNLQGQFTHQGMNRRPEAFADSPETTLCLPSVLGPEPIKGYENIRAALAGLKQKELDNDKNYIFLPFIMAPVITGSGNTAKGIWQTLSIEVQAQAFGKTEPPYDMILRVGRFVSDFVCDEAGKWKFAALRHEILFSLDPLPYGQGFAMRHRMREKDWDNTWLDYPSPSDVPCVDSVAEIEMMMPEWTGRIRHGNSMDFVDEHMVNPVEEISFMVAGSTQRRTWGYDNINARFGPRERTGRHENPAYHTLGTPVIQFSEDGTHATATWTDLAIADFSGAFEFPLDPVCYHMTADKYYHDFVLVDGEWKLYSFCWEPCIFMGAHPFREDKNRGFYKGWANMKADFPQIGEPFDYGEIDWQMIGE